MAYRYIDNKNRLIHKSELGTYRVLNSTNPYIITEEEFNNSEPSKIKNNEFSRLMNLYFKDVQHEWEWQETKFKKLPNFESSEYSLITNYDWKNLPKHDCGVYGKCIIVYHWGRLYYFTVSYNGYWQGQLLDMRTKSFVRWAQAKHSAPVKNCDTNQII